jgi:hypothetical protein
MTLEQILAEHADKWDLYEPATDAQRASARAAIKNLPIELEHFYAHSDGADIGDVSIFQIDDELLGVNTARTPKTRPFVFFASDGGDGFFAIDTQAKLKHGVGAVYWADRSSASLRSWIFCAASFAAFLQVLGTGATPWKARSLADVDLDQMVATLEAHHDRWTGGMPLELGDTFDAGIRVGVRFPTSLNTLLGVANGLRIPGAGVTIFDQDKITAVEGSTRENGRPGALWIANDADGNRYALTMIGWRGSEGSDVVRVGPGESAETAPIIGQLAAVVVAWLEGKKP